MVVLLQADDNYLMAIFPPYYSGEEEDSRFM
jgi:hypothetical protein